MVPENYYFDSLPLRPSPENDESLISFLTRVALVNQFKSINELWLKVLRQPVRLEVQTADYPPRNIQPILQALVCSETAMLKTTLYYFFAHLGYSSKAIRDRKPRYRNFLSHTLRYCPSCLDETEAYLLKWRFIRLPGCVVHGCRLFDRCETCGQLIPYISSLEYFGHCTHCNVRLREIRPIPLSEPELELTLLLNRELGLLLPNFTRKRSTPKPNILSVFCFNPPMIEHVW